MNTEIMKSIGKSSFIEKYPLLFALLVFIGTEIVLFVMGFNSNISTFSENPIKSIAVLMLKFLIFVSLAYGYIYFKSRLAKK